LNRFSVKLTTQSQTVTTSQRELLAAQNEESLEAKRLEELKEDLGGECPLCGAALP